MKSESGSPSRLLGVPYVAACEVHTKKAGGRSLEAEAFTGRPTATTLETQQKIGRTRTGSRNIPWLAY